MVRPSAASIAGAWFVIGASGVAASVTGTSSETALATVTIPAGILGPKGIIRLSSIWSCTNNGNAKAFTARFGGMSGTAYLNAVASGVPGYNDIGRLICNRNSASSQVGKSAVSLIGSASAAVVTSSIDTTAQQTIVFTGSLANSSDTLTLEAYIVEILRG